MTKEIERIRKIVDAGHACCGRLFIVDECIECGRDLDDDGRCEFCGYQDERAEITASYRQRKDAKY